MQKIHACTGDAASGRAHDLIDIQILAAVEDIDHAEIERIGRRLFASLLGGGPHSRLFTELREKRSLCYYAHAAPDRHKPVLFVHTGLDPAAAPAAEAEILRASAELAAGGFSAQEFATAKAQAISALRSVDDSLASRIAFAADQWWAATDRDPATQADAYARATPGQVVAAVAGMHYDGSYLLAPEAAP